MIDRGWGVRAVLAMWLRWRLTGVLLLVGCSELLVPESSQDLHVQDFEAAWAHIDSVYPLFTFKGIDWDEVHTTYRPRFEQVRGDEIFAVLSDLVAELRDGHAKVVTEGGIGVALYVPPRRLRDEGAFDPNVTRRYFESPLQVTESDAIEYEWAADGIGYIRIPTFGNALRGRTDEIDIVLAFLREASGLILDVRDNDGGSSVVYDPIISRFIDAPLTTEAAISRMGMRPAGTIVPHTGRRYTGPMVLLINGTSRSAAEVFAERMRQLGHVTLVGDTTAGAGVSSNTDPRHHLPSGKAIAINYEAVLRLDGEPIEWNGVPPDIQVPQSDRDVAENRDKQFEFAIEFLKRN